MGMLSDILHDSDRKRLSDAWDETEAAQDFAPLPDGQYDAHITAGELFSSRKNSTPGYKLTFKVIEGDHAGRQFWLDLWLTEPALPMTKRDLLKLGVKSMSQLERPLPSGIRCKVKLALRRDDNGTEFNRVRRFDVIGIDKPEQDAFAPADATTGEVDQANEAERDGEAATSETPL